MTSLTGRLRAMLAAAAIAACGAVPAPEPPAQATGLHGNGTLVVAASVGGTPFNLGADIALARSGERYRLDILSLGIPGTSSTVSSAASALLPPGGATLLYDGRTGELDAYSLSNHDVYRSVPAPGTPAPATAPAPPGGRDPLAALASVARLLHDADAASIQLLGHPALAGHPTENLDVMYARPVGGSRREQYHAQLWLADDLAGFPIRITLSDTPPTPRDFGGSLRLDLTSVTAQAPQPQTFAVPAGLTPVPSLGDVLQVHL